MNASVWRKFKMTACVLNFAKPRSFHVTAVRPLLERNGKLAKPTQNCVSWPNTTVPINVNPMVKSMLWNGNRLFQHMKWAYMHIFSDICPCLTKMQVFKVNRGKSQIHTSQHYLTHLIPKLDPVQGRSSIYIYKKRPHLNYGQEVVHIFTLGMYILILQ